MHSTGFFASALVFVVLVAAPDCWSDTVEPPSTPGMNRGTPAIARQGGVTHMVYADTDFTNVFIRYMQWGGTVSTPETVASTSSFQTVWPDVAVAPDGTVHVAYIVQPSLWYAQRSPGGGWIKEAVPGVNAPSIQALVVNEDGLPEVVWQQGSNIYFALREESGWSAPELVTTLPGGAPCNDLNMADAGEPILVAACPGYLTYALRDRVPGGFTWKPEFLGTITAEAADIAPGPDMDQILWCGGPEGQLYATIVIRTESPDGLLISQNTVPLVVSHCNTGSTGIAVDADGLFHGAFLGVDDSIWYMLKAGPAWTGMAPVCSGVTLPSAGSAGLPQAASVAVDDTGVFLAFAMAGEVHWTQGVEVGAAASYCTW